MAQTVATNFAMRVAGLALVLCLAAHVCCALKPNIIFYLADECVSTTLNWG